MTERLPLTPKAADPQPTGDHATTGASPQAAPGTSDLAVRPLPELLQSLHSTEAGLSASDAAAILETVGPNQIETVKPKSLLAAFIGRFSNPLVLILLVAAAVSAFTGDVPSFVIITVIVLMSVILDVAQEHQAENAAERLREKVSLYRQGAARRTAGRGPCDGRSCLAISFFSRPAISCPPMPG